MQEKVLLFDQLAHQANQLTWKKVILALKVPSRTIRIVQKVRNSRQKWIVLHTKQHLHLQTIMKQSILSFQVEEMKKVIDSVLTELSYDCVKEHPKDLY